MVSKTAVYCSYEIVGKTVACAKAFFGGHVSSQNCPENTPILYPSCRCNYFLKTGWGFSVQEMKHTTEKVARLE